MVEYQPKGGKTVVQKYTNKRIACACWEIKIPVTKKPYRNLNKEIL